MRQRTYWQMSEERHFCSLSTLAQKLQQSLIRIHMKRNLSLQVIIMHLHRRMTMNESYTLSCTHSSIFETYKFYLSLSFSFIYCTHHEPYCIKYDEVIIHAILLYVHFFLWMWKKLFFSSFSSCPFVSRKNSNNSVE